MSGANRLLQQISSQKHFRHLKLKPRTNKLVPTIVSPREPYVPPKDRVALWNIEPGDQVLVTTGSKLFRNRVSTVSKVDRATNRLYLTDEPFLRRKLATLPHKGAVFESDKDYSAELARPVPIHYSNCRLLLRRPESDMTGGRYDPEALRLAQYPERVVKSLKAVKLRRGLKRTWNWDRYASKVEEFVYAEDGRLRRATPEERRLTDEELAQQAWQRIPWKSERDTPTGSLPHHISFKPCKMLMCCIDVEQFTELALPKPLQT